MLKSILQSASQNHFENNSQLNFVLDLILEVEQHYDLHAATQFPNHIPEHITGTMENHVNTGLIGTRFTRTKKYRLQAFWMKVQDFITISIILT